MEKKITEWLINNKDLLISSAVLSIGTYARFLFGGRVYNWKQKLSLLLFGFVIVFLLHMSKLDPLYQTSISLVAGLLLPNIINSIIKAGERSEESASKKISKNIDKILD